jgi:tRNA-(MS[2]IO[6]A)-hydroxylase MiaE-like protein
VEKEATAELLAALAYGERSAAQRARDNVRFAPDSRRAEAQRGIADREERNCRLIEARLAELGSADLTRRFEPFFDAFFAHTEPTDWVEAQAFHYVGDALVSDFADTLVELVDPVSAEIVRHTLGEREDQEAFALEELTRALEDEPGAAERVAAYSRRIVGEGLTQTARALDQSTLLRELLGRGATEKRLVLDLLDHHRARLDRLGIERVEADSFD